MERGNDLKQLPQPVSRIFVPDRVAREVDKPRTKLHTWLNRHPQVVTRFVSEEGRLYLLFLREGLDDGEAAALAVAEQRHATLVTDDKAARRLAASRSVAVIDTLRFLDEVVPKQGQLGL